MNGVELIAIERQWQIQEEGWSAAHDDGHATGSLAIAGACYVLDYYEKHLQSSKTKRELQEWTDFLWPWDGKWWKPTPENAIRQLTKAGALIAAANT